jgi:hypothetical protein
VTFKFVVVVVVVNVHDISRGEDYIPAVSATSRSNVSGVGNDK